MFEHIRQAISLLRDAVRSADAGSWGGSDAAELLRLAAEAEHVAAALRVSATRQVASSKVWQRSAHQTAGHYVAAVTGSSITAANEAIRTAQRLEDLPLARAAFQAGSLSAAQVAVLADAAIAARLEEHTSELQSHSF